MNNERIQPSILESYPPARTLDFATIRNPLGASPRLDELSLYYDHATQEQLIEKLGSLWGISENQILVGNGSSEIIEQIGKLFLHADDIAVLPTPTYFGLLDVIPGDRIIAVPLSHIDHFAHTGEYQNLLLSTINHCNPAVVWLCTPNNPTGVVLPLEHIREIASATHGIVIVDEAYQEIVDPYNLRSSIHLIEEFPNIVVTRTFSKAYGLPEIKVGTCIAHPEIIRRLANSAIKPLPLPSLVPALCSLDDQHHILLTHQMISRETEYIWDEVQKLGNIEIAARSESGVCLFRHKIADLHSLLLGKGIETRRYEESGLKGERYVRLGLLNHEHNIALMKALRECDMT